MTQPLVITIIMNFNRLDDTLECLRSLRAQTGVNQQVIVLDFSAGDSAAEAMRAEFPHTQVMQLQENLGYAGNNNIGIRAALQRQPDWIFVLNEDTVLAPDCLSRMVEQGESDAQIGILGPMVYHHDEPDVIQSAGGIITRTWNGLHLSQNEPDRGQFSAPHAVDWITGCALLLRRSAIEQVGLLDERFFMYWEETEWCVRTGKAGWKLVHVPQAKLWHKGVQRNYQPKPAYSYYDTRNHLLLLAKHQAPLNAWLYTWLQILRTLVSWSIRPKWRSKRDHRNALWHGMLDFLRQRFGQMPT